MARPGAETEGLSHLTKGLSNFRDNFGVANRRGEHGERKSLITGGTILSTLFTNPKAQIKRVQTLSESSANWRSKKKVSKKFLLEKG